MHSAALWGLFVFQTILFGSSSGAQDGTPASPQNLDDDVRPKPADSLCDCDYLTEDSSFISVQYFLPPVFRDESSLKRYIRDPRFQQLRRACTDTLAVDAIFARALKLPTAP